MSELPYLKQVSRVKHRILRNYLPSWATILTSRYNCLLYIDCFAGGGQYVDENGDPLPGSPLIAFRLAQDFPRKRPGRSLYVRFVEKDHETAERLRNTLAAEGLSQEVVRDLVAEADAHDYVDQLAAMVKGWGPGKQLIPTFFFIDPFGHPVTVPTLRNLLGLGSTEILVNLMWYSINMHLNNPSVKSTIDRLFGHGEWELQDFMHMSGHQREQEFFQYLTDQVRAPFSLKFPVRFSPEDGVPGGERRNKFYLIHFSKHPKAALLMKEIMWKASDDVAELHFNGRGPEQQLRLFGAEPDLIKLRNDLLEEFQGRSLAFDQVRVETLDWPFVETHYRAVLKQMEEEGAVQIDRVESKKSGLKGRDIVRFP